MNQVIKTFKEAASFDGPSIIIAYSPCIAHGILKGMSNTIEEEKLAVESGYFPLFRYHPKKGFSWFVVVLKNIMSSLHGKIDISNLKR